MKKIIDLMLELNELDFKDQKGFKKYTSKHKIKPSTKVSIGGKTTTAGDAMKADDAAKETPSKKGPALSPEQQEKYATDISKAANDGVEFDGYDANDRPLFVSTTDDSTEYTVDPSGAIFKHGDAGESKIGNTSPDKGSELSSDNFEDTYTYGSNPEAEEQAYGAVEMLGDILTSDTVSYTHLTLPTILLV